MNLTPLTAISPIDGRYADKCNGLRDYFSEYALIRYRVIVEIQWLRSLSTHPSIPEIPALSLAAEKYLQGIVDRFDVNDAANIKEIERRTNHDVKAVEYYIKERLGKNKELKQAVEFIHFACTSEDINNLAYAMMLRDARSHQLIPALERLIGELKSFARSQANRAMLARTHGQPASPTTLGKEFAVFVQRLRRQLMALTEVELLGKISGATGNYSAHLVAYPDVDWPSLAKDMVNGLGLSLSPVTTQIEPHDFIAEYLHALIRINTILIDACRDIWGYVSIGYFRQRVIAGEVGSSTMPHKVNPINFENAEGNLGMANAVMTHLAEKLPISRWQRDLTDSTVLRNLGVGIGYTLIAYQAINTGLDRLEINTERLDKDLEENWEVLAEAVQTVMRRFGLPEPYEQLKRLTRGKRVNRELLVSFIQTLPLPEIEKHRLMELTPWQYIGDASRQALDL